MKIWQVWDGDYDCDWVVATYGSEALARDHAETYGLSRVEECEVLTALAPEAADPVLRAGRAAERAKDREEGERRYVESRERAQRENEHVQAITISDYGNPRLCHCRTFASDEGYFVTANGYCRYCGGWTPEVFRAARGEAELIARIDELDIHNRRKMRQLCGLSPEA